jgi:uncharacterized membrane protein HdeD (DUF308 family)
MNGDVRPCYTAECIRQVKEHSKRYFVFGISLVLLGVLAVMFSFATTIFSLIYLGAFLIVAGLFEGYKALKVRGWSRFFFMHIALGVLYVLVGIFVISNPILNAIALTLVWATFFIVSGIMRIFFALAKNVPHKMWIVVNGVISVLLGSLIWLQWPVSGLWVIGMFIGIDMIMMGWSWIMLSLAAKKI